MEKKHTASNAIFEIVTSVLALLIRCVVFCLVFRWLCL